MSILVIKFGTASISRPDGEPDERIILEIARQTAKLHPKHRIIIVSSGAVGAGKSSIKRYSATLSQRKAAAAVGNPVLVGQYARHFAPHGIAIAQSLCERGHFADRNKFLQLKETFETLWQNGIIPIVNENDVISDRELKFSDNDELATLLAAGFGAKALMLCTSLGGLLDESGKIVPKVDDVDSVFDLVRSETSALGLGGMTSKLTFAKLAVSMGIRVTIFGMQEENGLISAYEGSSGTTFMPRKVSVSARNRWLASGGLSAGQIMVDDGAVKALLKRKSLLAVGVTGHSGSFASGEIVEILAPMGTSEDANSGEQIGGVSKSMTGSDPAAGPAPLSASDPTAGKSQKHDLAGAEAYIPQNYRVIAVTRTRISAKDLKKNGAVKNLEVAHANDIVLL